MAEPVVCERPLLGNGGLLRVVEDEHPSTCNGSNSPGASMLGGSVPRRNLYSAVVRCASLLRPSRYSTLLYPLLLVLVPFDSVAP